MVSSRIGCCVVISFNPETSEAPSTTSKIQRVAFEQLDEETSSLQAIRARRVSG